MKSKFIFSIAIAIAATACAHAPKAPSTSEAAGDALEQAISGAQRSDENRARDMYRHPLETLQFFELQPGLHVVEISPGGGWYTEILAPYLKDSGKLTLAVFADDSSVEYRRNLNAKLKARIQEQADVFGNIEYSILELPDAIGPVAADGSADLILTFRNVHGWLQAGKAPEVFAAFYKALKPGGVLGIVQHRLPADREQDPKFADGYVHEQAVIDIAQQAGFVLVEKSEINANPKDTADHPEGVWTLPPALRLKDQDRDKYVAIGESDRMTLKFKKPE